MIGRRGVLGGLLALAAPAIVRPASLMRVRVPRLVVGEVVIHDGVVGRGFYITEQSLLEHIRLMSEVARLPVDVMWIRDVRLMEAIARGRDPDPPCA